MKTTATDEHVATMVEYLNELAGISGQDDQVGESGVADGWWGLFGRRILISTDRGDTVDTYPTAVAAREAFDVYSDSLTPDEHVGHFSRLGGTWWCDTCDSPYCDLA